MVVCDALTSGCFSRRCPLGASSATKPSRRPPIPFTKSFLPFPSRESGRFASVRVWRVLLSHLLYASSASASTRWASSAPAPVCLMALLYALMMVLRPCSVKVDRSLLSHVQPRDQNWLRTAYMPVLQLKHPHPILTPAALPYIAFL